MQRSKVDVILHFTWATWHREPLLRTEIEDDVHRALRAEAQALGCRVLAVGGTENHVHLLMVIPSTLTIADLMRRVKSVSSMVGRRASGAFFGWQDNYCAVSVSPRHRDRVIAYISDQKQHHARGTLWPAAEVALENTLHASARSPKGT